MGLPKIGDIVSTDYDGALPSPHILGVFGQGASFACMLSLAMVWDQVASLSA